MDSIDIAEKLEGMYPRPTLRLDAELHGPVTDAVQACAWTLFPDAMLWAVRHMLTDRSAPWFAEDRKKRLGMSLEELAAQKGGEAAFQTGEAKGGPFERLKEVLTKHRKDEGPFILGSEVSYGDLVAASFFECFKRGESKMYERLVGYDESFKKLHEACEPWLQKDD